MVFIEPRTEKTHIEQKISVSVDSQPQNIQFQQPEAQLSGKDSARKAFSNIIENIKLIIGKINLVQLIMPAKKRAWMQVKKCWNYMARNDVAKAKKAYDQLVNVYEGLPEGSGKTELYQEVYDIYSRLAQISE